MGAGQNQTSSGLVVTEAKQGMEQFKYEIANELGISPQVQNGYWGNISSRDCGTVGGHMVRRMVEQYERSVAGRSGQTGGGSQ